MARDLNKVMIIGRLGADPEMRYTPQGSAVTTFRVASGRQWNDSRRERREETEWFRVVAWEKLGEICNQYLTKGTRVYVEGRLQTRKWTDSDNVERYTTEVVISDMIILDSRDSRDSRRSAGSADDEVFPDEDAPAPAPRRQAGPRTGSAPARNVPEPISDDDDIPF